MSFPYVTLGSTLIDFMIQVHLAHTPIKMMCVYSIYLLWLLSAEVYLLQELMKRQKRTINKGCPINSFLYRGDIVVCANEYWYICLSLELNHYLKYEHNYLSVRSKLLVVYNQWFKS